MTDFKNLEDIFNDSDFEKLVSPLKPKEKKVADREVEKFIEIVDWVRESPEILKNVVCIHDCTVLENLLIVSEN